MSKNLFLAAVAALTVMLGCSKNEVDNTVVPEQDNIQFAPVVGKQTRATEVVSADLQRNGTKLSLYGYNATGQFDARTKLVPFFDNNPEALTYNGFWSTAKDYAWTKLAADEYLNIFTYYSPKSVLTGIIAPTQSAAARFAYTVPNLIAGQEDLLVATNLNMTKTTTNGIVTIGFKHALSQLYFKAKLVGTGYKAVIKSVKVIGAANTGSFVYATQGAEAGTWDSSSISGNQTYVYAESFAQDIKSKDIADRIAPENGSLMLLPQQAKGTFKFEITYDVYNAVSNAVIGANITKTAEMAALEMGKKYAYTLVLPATENDNIVFDVIVSDWDDTSVATEREVRFDEYKLKGANDDTAIADLITGYTPAVIYLQNVSVTADNLAASLAIDLKNLSTTAVAGSSVIIDCKLLEWNGNEIEVTVPAGWSVTSKLTANGKITVTKN